MQKELLCTLYLLLYLPHSVEGKGTVAHACAQVLGTNATTAWYVFLCLVELVMLDHASTHSALNSIRTLCSSRYMYLIQEKQMFLLHLTLRVHVCKMLSGTNAAGLPYLALLCVYAS